MLEISYFLWYLLNLLGNYYKTFYLLDIKLRFTCDKIKLNLNATKFQIIVMILH